MADDGEASNRRRCRNKYGGEAWCKRAEAKPRRPRPRPRPPSQFQTPLSGTSQFGKPIGEVWLQKEAAGGERIIVGAVDAAPPSAKYQKGTPGAGKDTEHLLRYVNDKSKRILGMEYRTMEDTAKAAVDDWEARGW
ncbi:hypothetical protein DFH06DRAFT_1128935 [Mycena polygramma]|nr:hypothetical protein DFH06DRAFT_1128935 [Mycena polygramma]